MKKLSEALTGLRTCRDPHGQVGAAEARRALFCLPGTQGFPEVQTSNPSPGSMVPNAGPLATHRARPGDRRPPRTASRCLCASGADSKTPGTVGELASSTPVPPSAKGLQRAGGSSPQRNRKRRSSETRRRGINGKLWSGPLQERELC